MTPRTWQRVKQLFSEAADLPTADRTAFVYRATCDQPELADEVLMLLALDPDADHPIAYSGLLVSLLTRPACPAAPPWPSPLTNRASSPVQVPAYLVFEGKPSAWMATANSSTYSPAQPTT